VYFVAVDVALVPPAVLTVTLTLPAADAGATTLMLVLVSDTNVDTDAVPNVTWVAFAKFVPAIVTVV
jgi:hypothetical protein